MAKIRIKGDTSGYIDIAAPAEAGTQTLTLPTSGSLLTSADVLDSDQIGTGAISAGKIASGAITTGLLPAGTVLQTLTDSTFTVVEGSSTTYQSTGLSVSITPSSASNKIVLMCSGTSRGDGGALTQLKVGVFKGGVEQNDGIGHLWSRATAGFDSTTSFVFSDTAGTTSAVTYEIRMRSGNGGYVRFPSNISVDPQAHLIVMEIAQ